MASKDDVTVNIVHCNSCGCAALAIEGIKTSYPQLAEWTGDPCLPYPHPWVTCNTINASVNNPFIIAVWVIFLWKHHELTKAQCTHLKLNWRFSCLNQVVKFGLHCSKLKLFQDECSNVSFVMFMCHLGKNGIWEKMGVQAKPNMLVQFV
jgi:hypothetical protein